MGHASAAVISASRGSPDGSTTIAFVSSSCAKVPDAYTRHIPLPMQRSRSMAMTGELVPSDTGCHGRLSRGEPVEASALPRRSLYWTSGARWLMRRLTVPMQSGHVESEWG